MRKSVDGLLTVCLEEEGEEEDRIGFDVCFWLRPPRKGRRGERRGGGGGGASMRMKGGRRRVRLLLVVMSDCRPLYHYDKVTLERSRLNGYACY